MYMEALLIPADVPCATCVTIHGGMIDLFA
jgi:hypothetical protein